MLDLLVIGAGLAGLHAALVAAEAGMRVRVIAKGLGALYWSAGTIDLLGYLPDTDNPVTQPFSDLDKLPPQHPYVQVGAEKVTAAFEHFAKKVREHGLDYAGAAVGRQNMWLPSPVGAGRPTYLAPAAQRTGSLWREQPMLIVGFDGLRDFYPYLIADNLSRQGYTARAVLLPLTVISHRRDSNTIQLAQGMDRNYQAQTLASVLRDQVRPGERIGLPAILGMQQHRYIVRHLQQALETPVFEIPTLPPSAPGMRLYNALSSALASKGVRVEIGMAVCNFHAGEHVIDWVETETGSRPLRHHAQNFLLATGGILGGGFDSHHTDNVWETVFDLPLTIPVDRSRWFHPHFLHKGGQPIFRGGIATNNDFQPITANGAPIYHNLWAAGNGLANTDPIRERSREGLAIATGYAAVQSMIQLRA